MYIKITLLSLRSELPVYAQRVTFGSSSIYIHTKDSPVLREATTIPIAAVLMMAPVTDEEMTAELDSRKQAKQDS